MKRFEFIEHTADKGVDVWSDSMELLYGDSAYALFSFMADLEAYIPTETRALGIVSVDREALFVKWLSELVYLFDTESVLFTRFEIESLTETSLTAVVSSTPIQGETFDTKGALVKAITFHGLVIEQTPEGFHARYYVDV